MPERRLETPEDWSSFLQEIVDRVSNLEGASTSLGRRLLDVESSLEPMGRDLAQLVKVRTMQLAGGTDDGGGIAAAILALKEQSTPAAAVPASAPFDDNGQIFEGVTFQAGVVATHFLGSHTDVETTAVLAGGVPVPKRHTVTTLDVSVTPTPPGNLVLTVQTHFSADNGVTWALLGQALTFAAGDRRKQLTFTAPIDLSGGLLLQWTLTNSAGAPGYVVSGNASVY